uniref:G protein-coupled receptor n=1 Tax=Haemonchus contortus TaxID=6289 RepID=A0A7I4YPK4_HAECO
MEFSVLHLIIDTLVFLLYSFVLFIIIRSKTKVFKSAFYSIFVATGFADIASLFSACSLRVIRESSLGEGSKDFALFCILITYTSFMAHMIGNLLITINRYSALCLMNMYNEIWTRKHVLAAIIIQYFISVGVFAHAIRAHVEYIPGANGTAIIKGIQERDIDLIIRFTYIVTCIIYATTSLGLNIRLLIEWKRLTKTDGALERSHHDKGLLIYALLGFSGSMLVCIQQFVKFICVITDNTSLNLWATLQYSVLNGIMVSIPPFSLIMLSSDFRHEVLNYFGCSKQQICIPLFVTRHSSIRPVADRF